MDDVPQPRIGSIVTCGADARCFVVVGHGETAGRWIGAAVSVRAASEAATNLQVELGVEVLARGVLPQPALVALDRTEWFETAPASIVAELTPAALREVLQAWTRVSVRAFSRAFHAAQRPGEDPARAAFVPGSSTVPYAGRVFNEEEVEAAVGSTLDFWLTLGPEGEAFERDLARYIGTHSSLLTNSGSSANLLAFLALTTHKLPRERRILPGDEVITVAAGFPTTVAPIVQYGAVPVFIDNDPLTGNADVSLLEAAYTPGRTKAVMLAHTLGNPFDLAAVLRFCHRHNLWLIEDNCDALGCTYSLPESEAGVCGLTDRQKEQNLTPGTGLITLRTGAWGDLSTQSFYPPHHLTMGEGGAVNVVRRASLRTYAESFRDWGRDCWCPSGKDNTCRKRFEWQLGELPDGYDHKYIYSHLGYNLKPLDPQAAIGRSQLRKLPAFVEARKRNWEVLRRGLADLSEFFEFSRPTHATAWHASHDAALHSRFDWDATGCRTHCSWFGFLLLVREDAPFTPSELAHHLDSRRIGNRMLFGGNLLRQPAFVQLRRERAGAVRVVTRQGPIPDDQLDALLRASATPGAAGASASPLPGADRLMRRALFLGTYPGLTPAMLDYEVETIRAFVASKTGR